MTIGNTLVINLQISVNIVRAEAITNRHCWPGFAETRTGNGKHQRHNTCMLATAPVQNWYPGVFPPKKKPTRVICFSSDFFPRILSFILLYVFSLCILSIKFLTYRSLIKKVFKAKKIIKTISQFFRMFFGLDFFVLTLVLTTFGGIWIIIIYINIILYSAWNILAKH